MFQDAYIKLDRLEVEDILDRTKKSFDGVSFNPENTVIMSRDLPFYSDYRFYDIADHTHMPPSRRFLLMKDQDIVVMDFTNTPIYSLNSKVPIQIDRENVKDYVRFFFTFVRGRHGRFIIVETVDDIAWREEPPPAARKSIAKLIKPIAFHASDKGDGSYFMQAQMMFRDSLFQADVLVNSDGLVQLSNESLLIEDMPVLDDTFGQ
ncbi:MAG: hypothetical protein KDJ26_06495 [Alphaproteobacteria bacterium]|jgi:hypothetical protein|nr:hypothetical protein [Alphaproteobacteria bacterium]MCB1551632.1 hypothetical protein [Alphaproteobacteria bacterium]MCB9985821.1 hypothetical protein [Micavibrio sp.]HRK97545.1 hypothetical protein [Alphaproteobacteria bacterium]